MRYNCITVLRESIRRDIKVSQSIEMAFRIDITVLQSIEMAVRRDKSVLQPIEIALELIDLCHSQ